MQDIRFNENLPILNDNYEYLIDNDDYNTLIDNPQDYLIVYSYIHNIIEVAKELIQYNIEFTHKLCHLSDETYLLIKYK